MGKPRKLPAQGWSELPAQGWSNSDWEFFTDWLKGVLEECEVYILFTKKDGTVRKMRCTAYSKKVHTEVAHKKHKNLHKKVEDRIMVYDLDKKVRRSFLVKSVKYISFNL